MSDTDDISITARARRLREARSRAFPSAQAAAAALGINPATARAHENGQNGFPLAAAQRYAEAYGVAIDWLLTGSNTNTAVPPQERRTKPPVSMTSLPDGKARLEMSVTLPFAVAVQVLALVQDGDRS